jgi:hypothetical protein
MNNQFYYLNRAWKKGEIYLKSLIEYEDQKLKVKKYTPEKPMPMVIDKGKKYFDILTFTDPFNWAVSDKFKEVLAAGNVTGWDSFPVDIEGSDIQYHGFQVTGKSGPLDRSAGKGWTKGYKFDLSTWDGSDFFCPEETLIVFITEKAKQLLEQSKLTNLSMQNIMDCEWYI